MVHYIDLLKKSKVAVIGAGGAGDIISSFVFCEVLRDLFSIRSCIPVAILWERWIIDPYPGPIPRNLLRNVRLSDCVYVNKETYAVRGSSYNFKPQASIVSEIIGTEIPAITLEYGVEGYIKCLDELYRNGIDHVIALDVGGDILGTGYEDNLWSPLTDSLTVAALIKNDQRMSSSIAVLALGADGELSQDYILTRISEVTRLGGYLGSIGLWSWHTIIYERILNKAHTEAGVAPYKALKGINEIVAVRDGTRQMIINPISTIAFLLSADIIADITILPKHLANTRSLAEAVAVAEKLGIPTELHLEIEVAKEYGCGIPSHKVDWHKVKERIKSKTNALKGDKA